MTMTAPVLKENSILGGNRQDECPSSGLTTRPAGPPMGGDAGGMGLDGSGNPERLVGVIWAKGKWKGSGESGDGCDVGRRVLWADGFYPLKTKDSCSVCDLEFQRSSPRGQTPRRLSAAFWNARHTSR